MRCVRRIFLVLQLPALKGSRALKLIMSLIEAEVKFKLEF
jgi:hypothetical protein